MTLQAPAPQVEIGYAQAVNYNWWLYENETTPELIWPQSTFVFDSMRRTDSQVTSVLRAMTLPVRRTPWRIDPNGASPKVVQFVADDLGLPIVGQKAPKPPPRSKDRFSWPDHLRQALLMLSYGHMYFEQVYRVDPDGSAAHLRKLAPRMPKTIERIDVAADGGLISIKQWWSPTNSGGTTIPVNRLVAYIHEREGGNWLGTSILRPAYKNWLLKDRLLRVQAQTIERNGMGIPLYKGAENASNLDAGLAMAKAWRAGDAAGSAVPFGADLILRGVEGTLPDAEPAVRYHDEQIGRAVLAHFLNLGTQTGSWALGTTFADFFTLSLQTLADQVADTATQHIVEDLVDINFGEDEPAPRIVCDEIGSRQAATAESLAALVKVGLVHPDEILEESTRQQYGLPPKDPNAPPPGPLPTSLRETMTGQLGPDGKPLPDAAAAPASAPDAGSTDASAAVAAMQGVAASGRDDDPQTSGGSSLVGPEPIEAKFNVRQFRGFHGRWAKEGDNAATAAHKAEPPTRMADLAHELHGLTPRQSRVHLRKMGFKKAEIDNLLKVGDRPTSMSDLAHDLDGLGIDQSRAKLAKLGFSKAEIDHLAPESAPSMSDIAAEQRPTSMSDLAHELDGLSLQDAHAKMRAMGFDQAEIDDLLGSDKPTMADLEHELQGLSLTEQRAHLRGLGFTQREIRDLLGIAPLRASAGDDALGEDVDEQADAITAALDEWVDSQIPEEVEAKFNPDELRVPGGKGGGRWTANPIGKAISDALDAWGKGKGPDDPFTFDGKPIDREPLRKAAVARGITLKRGASREDIVHALLGGVRDEVKTQRAERQKRVGSSKFSIDHGGKRIDVAVYTGTDPNAPSLREISSANRPGRVITSQPDLAGLERWAHDNGHTDVAQWAASERARAEAKSAPKAAKVAKKAAPRAKKVASTDVTKSTLAPPPSGDELKAIAEVHGRAAHADGGWVRKSDMSPASARHLDALVEQGWLQKHSGPDGDLYRVDPRSAGTRKGQADSAALVGDILPAPKTGDSQLRLTELNRGAIIEGHVGPDGAFSNEPTPGSRMVRVVVQRVEPLDQHGQPVKAPLLGDVGELGHFQMSGEKPMARIIGHDADTGRRVESDVVSAYSHWSWHMNPDTNTSADIEGEILPTPQGLSGAPKVPAKKAASKAAKAALSAADRAEVSKVASAFHEDWRKTRLQGDGSFEPRVKTTKDAAWISAHGTDQVDIANTKYADLPDDWQKENRDAAEVAQRILKEHGGTVDLTDEKARLAVGEQIHQAWLSRENNSYAKGGPLDVPFADLPRDEQDKDTDQLKVAMGALAPAPKAAPKKAGPRASWRTSNNAALGIKTHTTGLGHVSEFRPDRPGDKPTFRAYRGDIGGAADFTSLDEAKSWVASWDGVTPGGSTYGPPGSRMTQAEFVKAEKVKQDAAAAARVAAMPAVPPRAELEKMPLKDLRKLAKARDHKGMEYADRRPIVDALLGDAKHDAPSAPHPDGLDAYEGPRLKSYAAEFLDSTSGMDDNQLRAALRAQGVGSPAVEQAKRAAEDAAAPKVKAGPSLAEAQLDNRILSNYRAWTMQGRPGRKGDALPLETLRQHMGNVSPEEFDAAVKRLTAHGAEVTPSGIRVTNSDSVPLPPAGWPKLSSNPAERLTQIQDRIEQTYRELATRPGGDFASLTNVRDRLGPDVSRDEFDRAVIDLSRRPDVKVVPESNQKMLTARDRAASVSIGNQDRHLIMITDPSPAGGARPKGEGRPPEAALARSVASGVTRTTPLTQGKVGETRIDHFGDGHQAVYKKSTQDWNGANPKDQADAEELASLVGQSLGAPVPAAHRIGDDEIYLDYVHNAKTGDELGFAPYESPGIDPEGSHLLGLTGLLINDPDQHSGNYMVDGDNRVHGIDHGLAWSPTAMGMSPDMAPQQPGPFGRDFIQPGGMFGSPTFKAGPFSADELKAYRKRIEALQADFERLGRDEWHQFALARLDALIAAAGAAR